MMSSDRNIEKESLEVAFKGVKRQTPKYASREELFVWCLIGALSAQKETREFAEELKLFFETGV